MTGARASVVLTAVTLWSSSAWSQDLPVRNSYIHYLLTHARNLEAELMHETGLIRRLARPADDASEVGYNPGVYLAEVEVLDPSSDELGQFILGGLGVYVSGGAPEGFHGTFLAGFSYVQTDVRIEMDPQPVVATGTFGNLMLGLSVGYEDWVNVFYLATMNSYSVQEIDFFRAQGDVMSFEVDLPFLGGFSVVDYDTRRRKPARIGIGYAHRFADDAFGALVISGEMRAEYTITGGFFAGTLPPESHTALERDITGTAEWFSVTPVEYVALHGAISAGYIRNGLRFATVTAEAGLSPLRQQGDSVWSLTAVGGVAHDRRDRSLVPGGALGVRYRDADPGEHLFEAFTVEIGVGWNEPDVVDRLGKAGASFYLRLANRWMI